MMKDWLKKIFGRQPATKTNKVQIDMRYEVHTFKSNETDAQDKVSQSLSKVDATSPQKPTK